MGDACEAPKRDTYLLSRNTQSSARLTFQHYALIDRQGWILHPTIREGISTVNPSDLRIADLATGNGIWLYELSKQYPQAELVGLDISPDQFPPPYTHPKNLRLDLLGLEDTVPEEFLGYFDVVHIRLVVAAVYNMDITRVVSNVMSMLKPGGYLQWDEITWPLALTVDGTTGQVCNDALSPAWERLLSVSPFENAAMWANTLPEVLAQHGLQSVESCMPPVKVSALYQEHQSKFWVFNELFEYAVRNEVPGALEQYALALKEATDSFAEGKLWAFNWLIAVGRKGGADKSFQAIVEGWLVDTALHKIPSYDDDQDV